MRALISLLFVMGCHKKIDATVSLVAPGPRTLTTPTGAVYTWQSNPDCGGAKAWALPGLVGEAEGRSEPMTLCEQPGGPLQPCANPLSLAAVVDAVKLGGTVCLAPGDHKLTEPLVLPGGVTLLGAGATLIVQTPSGSTEAMDQAVLVQGKGVAISGLKIIAPSTSVNFSAIDVAGGAEDVVIEDVQVTGGVESGPNTISAAVRVEAPRKQIIDNVLIRGLKVSDMAVQFPQPGPIDDVDHNRPPVAAMTKKVRTVAVHVKAPKTGLVRRVAIVDLRASGLRPSNSEVVALNGRLEHWAVLRSRIYNVDNIAIDAQNGPDDNLGKGKFWHQGGLIAESFVSRSLDHHCAQGAAIYVDGASSVWVKDNIVVNGDVGYEFGSEDGPGMKGLAFDRNFGQSTPRDCIDDEKEPHSVGKAVLRAGDVRGCRVQTFDVSGNAFVGGAGAVSLDCPNAYRPTGGWADISCEDLRDEIRTRVGVAEAEHFECQ